MVGVASSSETGPVVRAQDGHSSEIDARRAAFMAEIADVARAVDARLAEILENGSQHETRGAPWKGERRRGLELCLSMLRYARTEFASAEERERLDAAVARVEQQLRALAAH